ncbi:MAG: 50S ribosomal protein L33 [Parcubacteria group bacterium SW_4_49_11]|jgi:large subunit ribosomal protein L33|nr:MAG: 50S ribosomal protein L33 [Parcubacteria group bacterium SW_4_49_11]
MSQDNLIKLRCTECEQPNYFTRKNMAKTKGEATKLELKKHCPTCNTHTVHREAKKSK